MEVCINTYERDTRGSCELREALTQFFLFDYAKYDNRILNFSYLLRISHHLSRYTCPQIAEQYNKTNHKRRQRAGIVVF